MGLSLSALLLSRQQGGPVDGRRRTAGRVARWITTECSFNWKEFDAGLVAGSGRFHCCAGYGLPALRRKVPSGQSMILIPDVNFLVFVSRECTMLSSACGSLLLFCAPTGLPALQLVSRQSL